MLTEDLPQATGQYKEEKTPIPTQLFPVLSPGAWHSSPSWPGSPIILNPRVLSPHSQCPDPLFLPILNLRAHHFSSLPTWEAHLLLSLAHKAFSVFDLLTLSIPPLCHQAVRTPHPQSKRPHSSHPQPKRPPTRLIPRLKSKHSMSVFWFLFTPFLDPGVPNFYLPVF